MAIGPYDVMFTIASGANAGSYGFMLRSTEAKTKDLQVQEIGLPPVDRLLSLAQASYQDFDARYDTVFAMASFAGGLGQLEYEHGGVAGSGDPERYWWGDGVVTHVDGKVYPCPAPSITNPEFGLPEGPGGFLSYLTNGGVRRDLFWCKDEIYSRATGESNYLVQWERIKNYNDDVHITDMTQAMPVGSNVNGVLVARPAKTGTEDYSSTGPVTGDVTWTTNGTTSVFDDTLGKPRFFAWVKGTVFAAVNPNKLFMSSDMVNWVGPITITHGSGSGNNVGNASHNFVGLLAANDYVLALKEDAIYAVTPEQDVEEIVWQFKERPSLDNFKYHAVIGDAVAFTVGNEVYIYDPLEGSLAPLGVAGQDGFSISQLHGVGADNGYIYVLATVVVPGIHANNRIAILRAYRRGRRWAFECVYSRDVAGASVQGFGCFPGGLSEGWGPSLTSKTTRLYWGIKESADDWKISMMDFPYLFDETHEPVKSGVLDQYRGTLYTSISRAGFPGFLKRHLWLGVESTNLQVVDLTYYSRIKVSYSTNSGATFTLLGTADETHERFNYPDINGNSIILKFEFEWGGSGGLQTPQTKIPILRVFDHHQRVRFRYLPVVNARIEVGDYLERNNGSRDPRTAPQLILDLLKLRQEDGAITYEDILGHNFKCSVTQLAIAPVTHEVPDRKVEMEAVIEVARSDSGA